MGPNVIRFLSILALALGVSQVRDGSSSIEGVVIDAVSQQPVAGVRAWAQVSVDISPEDLLLGRVQQQIVQTDAQGRFRLEKIPEGRTTLSFNKDGYRTQSAPYTFGADHHIEGVQVLLFPFPVVSGRVFEHNAPAAKAIVQAFQYRTTSRGSKELVAVSPSGSTNDQGEFRILELLPGRYFFGFESVLLRQSAIAATTERESTWALYPGVGNLSRAATVEIKGGDETKLETITLSNTPTGRVRLRLVNSGEPAKRVFLTLMYLTPTVQQVGSGGAGRVPPAEVVVPETRNLVRDYWPYRPGLYKFEARWQDAGGEIRQSAAIEFTGEDLDTEIILRRPIGRLEISGLLEQPDGTTKPLSGMTIDLCRVGVSACTSSEVWVSQGASPVGRQVSPRLGPEGTLELEELVEGQYELYSLGTPQNTSIGTIRQGDADVLVEGISVTTRSPKVEIKLRANPGSLQGTVVDAQGRFLQNALVFLLPDPPFGNVKLEAFRRLTRTDQNGLFDLSGINPGAYHVYALAKGSDDLWDKEYLAQFQGKGTSIRITDNNKPSVTLTALDEK